MPNSKKAFWNHLFGQQPRARSRAPLARHRRVFLEGLEDRRVLAPGDLDLSFGGGDGIVTTAIGTSHDNGRSVAVDSVGNYIVAGYSNNGSNNDFALTRYTSAGVLDLSFGGGDGVVTTNIGASDAGHSMAIDSAGNYIVAGFSNVAGTVDFALVRYTSAGVLDLAFGGGDGIVTTALGGAAAGQSVAVDGSGNYVVAGSLLNGANYDFALVRYTSVGALDLSFGGGDGIVTTAIGTSDDQARGIVVDSSGNYVVVGSARIGPTYDFALARYTAAGVLDTTFGAGGIVTTEIGTDASGISVIENSAGNYVVTGVAWIASNQDFALARYTSAGVLDTTFGGGDGIVTTPISSSYDVGLSVAEDSAGNYVVAGVTWNGVDSDFALASYTTAGILDVTFGSGDGVVTTPIGTSGDEGYSVAVDSAGNYVVAGFSWNGLNDDFALARYEGAPVGSLSASLSAGNLTITDIHATGKNNNLTVSLSGANVVITDTVEQFSSAPAGGALSNGNRTLTIPFSSITGSLTFNTMTGNDTVTINLASGDPIPASGVTFNGGNPTTGPGDKLVIAGGSQGTVTYNYTNANDGNIVMSSFGMVTYLGLEAPIANSGTASDVIVNLPAAASTVTFGDDGTGGNSLSRLSSSPTTFSLTEFTNPTGSLTINRGNAADTITVNALSDFNASLSIGMVVNPFSTLNFTGAVSFAATKNLTAFAESAIVSARLDAAGGNVTISSTGALTLSDVIATAGGAVDLIADSDGNGSGTLTVSGPVMSAWAQQGQLTETGGTAGDNSGISVALSSDGNTAIVGAYNDDVGVNSNQGSAAIYVRTGGVWTQQGLLTASDGSANDNFGIAVALSSDGNTAIIGANNDDIGGNVNQGSAYIFARIGSAWSQQSQLTVTTGGASGDNLGNSVALSANGNTACVGVTGDDIGASSNQGSAVIFTRTGTLWSQQVQLTVSGSSALDGFGNAVALSSDGDTLVAGSMRDDVGANLDQGSVTVFHRTGTAWSQQAQLVVFAGGAGDFFGSAVALSDDGNIALIGSRADTVGTNGNQGSATIFSRIGTTWSEQVQLISPVGLTGDAFGFSVSLNGSGDLAVISSPWVNVGVVNDYGVFDAYRRSGGVWLHQQQTAAVSSDQIGLSGYSVDVSADGSTILSGGIGVRVGTNGAQGAAFPFTNTAGSSGGAILAGSGMVTLKGADVDLLGIVSSTTTVTITPQQPTRGIDLGTNTAGSVGLTDGELDRITAGTLLIGNSLSGAVTVTGAISRSVATVLNVNTAAAINFTTGSLNSAGGNITLNPGTSVSAATSGVDVSSGAGTLVFGTGDDLIININGPTVDTQYQQLNVAGVVSLTGADLVVTGIAPALGDSFVIVNNDGSDAIVGTFTGLAEGALVNVNGVNKQITYVGGDGNDVALAINTLHVTSFSPTTTGALLNFNRDLDPAQLNLYDLQGGTFGPADVTLVGATVGAVRGSLVIDPNLRRLTFIRTTGVLPPDSYTLTLRSAADGFVDTTASLLDGDANGTAGGNYVQTFSLAAPPANAVTLSVANFARGPQQVVNVPANGTSGLPISFSDGNGITSANFELRYNPALLNITGATVAPGLTGATVNINTSTPGVAVIQFTSSTPLAAGTTRFIDLQANVPTSAPYRTKQMLDFTNISLNAGLIPAVDDDALHITAYFGDTTGNGTYSATDAGRISRVSVGFDTGFPLYKLLDPSIIGDISGAGGISSTDASRMLQAAVGFPVAEVPLLPLPAVSLVAGGPDPKLSIPTNLIAAAGSELIVPVHIDSIVDLTGTGLESADLVIYYDASVLDVTSASLGSLIANHGNWMIASRIDALSGRIFVSLAGNVPLEGFFQGELVQLHATVKANAPVGSSAINLAASARNTAHYTHLNEGFLTLIPAPTNAANDAGVDGVLTVLAAASNPSPTAPAVRVVDNNLVIVGTSGDDRIFVAALANDLVRVRVGSRLLGDFLRPSGLAIDGLAGHDFIYVDPALPATVIAADTDPNVPVDDLIFAAVNSLLVSDSLPGTVDSGLATGPLTNFDPRANRDLALLQMLADWSDQQAHEDPDGPPLRISRIRRR